MMINSAFNHISFEDSYLLGWEKSIGTMVLNVELLLTDKHHLFEPYNEESEHGCYKVGRIIIEDLVSITGLPCDRQELQWNEETHEYDDIAEIDSLLLLDDHSLRIEADEYMFEVNGGSIIIDFD
jgi:hypothetical protein